MKIKIGFFGIQYKLILFFTFLIIMMSSVSYIIYINATDTVNRFKVLMYNVVVLNNILNSLDSTQKNLEEYLTLKTGETVNNFNTSYDKFYKNINSFSLNFSTEDEYMAFRNIKGMTISFGEDVDKAIWASRGREEGVALDYFNESKRISGYMEDNIKFLVLSYLSRSEPTYFSLSEEAARAQTIIVSLIIVSAVFTVIYAVFISKDITTPIAILTKSARKISGGEFDIEEINFKGNDEISILAAAFNKMTWSIKKYIDEIHEKINIEKRLQEKEMENLRINSLLRESELKALQSQINPHFLFNTLSCISQTALIEEADDTYDLLETVSDMLRYNLRRIDKEVTLEDEVSNLKRYIVIQKARYRNRMSFNLHIENDELLKIGMPCLTLQPIVENSFMHGIEKLEKPGKIAVNIYGAPGRVVIEIQDTGAGMSRDKIKAILYGSEPGDDAAKGHTTGIGIKNVIERLRYFYNHNDVVDIESQEGEGTRITLNLPYGVIKKDV